MLDDREIIVDFITSKVADPKNRLTSNTNNFTADGSTTDFTITPTSGNHVYAIIGITVDGSSVLKWQDYSFDPSFNSKVVSFNTAPVSGTIVITFYEGTETWIYPDTANEDLIENSYPIARLTRISSDEVRNGNYQASVTTNVTYQVSVFAKEKIGFTIESRSLSGGNLSDYLVRKIREAFRDDINELYPKLYDYNGQSLVGPRFEEDRQSWHSFFDLNLNGEDLGE